MKKRTYLARLASTALVAAAALATSLPASAATVVFDFGANPGGLNTGTNPDTYSMSNGGVTVNVSAYNGLSAVLNQVSFSNGADVTHSASGLGVAGNNSSQINDNGLLSLGEGLLLTFSQSVDLTQAVFGNFGSGDSVGFEWGSPLNAGETLDPMAAPGGIWNGSFTGTQFFFAANTLTRDSFTLGGVTVNVASVPEPSTWAMLILGFGVIGGVMRRKQRQTVRYGFA